jgi:hypothetical protein
VALAVPRRLFAQDAAGRSRAIDGNARTPTSQRFVRAIERFTETEGVDLVTFENGQRKDDV